MMDNTVVRMYGCVGCVHIIFRCIFRRLLARILCSTFTTMTEIVRHANNTIMVPSSYSLGCRMPVVSYVHESSISQANTVRYYI